MIASITASSAIESDAPSGISGNRSALLGPNTSEIARVSWLLIQLVLPLSVLISPLCAITRKG